MQKKTYVTKALSALAVLAAWGADAGHAAEAPALERGLVKQAPALIKTFKERGYQNVGVLKFLVAASGSKGLSDNVGTLNMLLARRLEVALVLANDPKKPVGIIKNASAVAARTRGANHRNPEGRKRLFEPEYRLAWSKRLVKADAFVTGTAQVSKDLRTLTVSLFLFDKETNKLKQVGDDFRARNDAGKLAEMGESFVLRGMSNDVEAVGEAGRVRSEEAKHPLAGGAPPVKLEVLYGGKRVKVEYRDGRAYVPEPRAGQRVVFRLRRDGTKARYGAVLKVNGENTVGRERLPDVQCRRWILDPGRGPLLVTGYQLDDKTSERFRVLSRAESKAREMDYGADVGTITLTVFRERKTEDETDPAESREDRNARMVAQGSLPEEKETYESLKAAMLAESNAGETRGIIGQGEKEKKKVRVVKFTPDPTPVMTATIVYYRP
jgi:hypothetical protein